MYQFTSRNDIKQPGCFAHGRPSAWLLVISVSIAALTVGPVVGDDRQDADAIEPFLASPGELKPAGALPPKVPRLKLVAVRGDSRFCHPEEITSIRYSPDGRTIAAGGRNFVSTWDANTGKKLCHSRTEEEVQMLVRWCHTRPLILVAGHSGKVFLLHAKTGHTVRELGRLSNWVRDAAISADDQFAAAVDLKGDAILWNLKTHTELPLREIPSFRKLQSFESLQCVAFSHDGRQLLIAGVIQGPHLRILDLQTKQVRTYWPENSAQFVRSIDISPDDRFIAVGYGNGIVELRRLRDLSLVWVDKPPNSIVAQVRFDSRTRKVLVMRVHGLKRRLESYDVTRSSSSILDPA